MHGCHLPYFQNTETQLWWSWMDASEKLVLKNAVASCKPNTNKFKSNTLKYAVVDYINGYNLLFSCSQISWGIFCPTLATIMWLLASTISTWGIYTTLAGLHLLTSCCTCDVSQGLPTTRCSLHALLRRLSHFPLPHGHSITYCA